MYLSSTPPPPLLVSDPCHGRCDLRQMFGHLYVVTGEGPGQRIPCRFGEVRAVTFDCLEANFANDFQGERAAEAVQALLHAERTGRSRDGAFIRFQLHQVIAVLDLMLATPATPMEE